MSLNENPNATELNGEQTALRLDAGTSPVVSAQSVTRSQFEVRETNINSVGPGGSGSPNGPGGPGGPITDPDKNTMGATITSPANEAVFNGNSTTGVTIIIKGFAYGNSATVTAVKVTVGSVSGTATLVQRPIDPQNASLKIYDWSFQTTRSNVGQRKVTITAAAVGTAQKPNSPSEVAITLNIIDNTPPSLTILSPPNGFVVGSLPNIKVRGTASDNDGIIRVECSLDGGAWILATSSSNWADWSALLSTTKLGPHTVAARCFDKAGNTVQKTVAITAKDMTSPTLSISSPANNAIVTEGTVQLLGWASDQLSGVKQVSWEVAPLNPADPPQTGLAVLNTPGNWSSWSANIPLKPGLRRIRVSCEDNAGNKTFRFLFLNVVRPFAFKDRDPLGALTYLADLLEFATERVRLKQPPQSTVTAAMLTNTFHQPFEVLLNTLGKATPPPVLQIRVCVEVLRKYLASLTPSDPVKSELANAESRYRQSAYENILTQFGASYEEIRLARLADNNTRQALAERLGIDLNPSGQEDRLARLLLKPSEISDATLEKLFGLPDTTQDPLRITPTAELLTWKLEHLRILWRQQDYATDPITDAPLPIIEPDLVSKEDLDDADAFDQASGSNNAVFALWQERQKWATARFNELKALRESPTGPKMSGFERIAPGILGPVQDLAALAEKYKQGEDIKPQLKQKQLSLPAFLYLMRIRDLEIAGSVLDQEWEEAYSILVQVQKVRAYPAWREAEQQQNLTLGPDSFTMTPRDTLELPAWRATRQARQAWRSALQANVQQEQTVEQAFQTAIDAVEETTMPALRTALITAITKTLERLIEIDFDVENWLTERLLIDVKSNSSQKITRVHQATETLQDFLFSLRTGRFDEVKKRASRPPKPTVPTSPGPFPMPPKPTQLLPEAGANIGIGTPPSFDPSPAVNWLLGDEAKFDLVWKWLGSYATWRSAMFVFLYPENLLFPSLRETNRTTAFPSFVRSLQREQRLTPERARQFADSYLQGVKTELGAALPASLGGAFKITEQLSETELANRRSLTQSLFGATTNPHAAPPYLKEIFYFVPLAIALQLQKAGEFLAALDWFQTVYAYNLPLEKRNIYYGLTLEHTVATTYVRTPVDWLVKSLNPHDIAITRTNAYVRFTLLSLVQCLLDFADAEFTRDQRESISRARSLYLTALELLRLSDMQTPSQADGAKPPENLVLQGLRLRAELNLAKLRAGLNIAGMRRPLDLDTELGSGFPTLDGNGQLVLRSRLSFQPTPYYYAVLIERTKQLVTIAQQIEASFLSAVEKRDAENYTYLKARHDLSLAIAGVELQRRRVTEATSGKRLAEHQQQRAQIQADHYQHLLEEGTSDLEKQALDEMNTAAGYYSDAADLAVWGSYVSAASSAFSGALQGIEKGGPVVSILSGASNAASAFISGQIQLKSLRASAASTRASLFSTQANYERRTQEWKLQQSLSLQDVTIGNDQITLAEDHLDVIEQDQAIAEMQEEHAQAAVNFLTNKFTNTDLYEWMSGVLGRVYNYFLQQATAMARLAQDQLAFERQEIPPSFIQSDYWQVRVESGLGAGVSNGSDRQGLTGSARLLQDIYQLDAYAFETNKRKLQLTQTFSLARMAPFEFQRFRETGQLLFATPMELFDQQFPGHYLRLVRRVRTSVIALVPPTQGIRATLMASGLSRTVIDGAMFQPVVIRRHPELVALTSPSNATGLFELDIQSDMLLPFEGMGVDTTWELQMPKAANPFDYRTIADVLITFEYTALNNFTYRQQVIQSLKPETSADRPFSLRSQFADQWYELHNPEQSATPMVVRFKTTREDFPPNLDALKIQQVVLYFTRAPEQSFEVSVSHLHFTEKGSTVEVGGGASSIKGVISTRRGNAGSWAAMIGRSPVGEWELALPDNEQTRELLATDLIEDILLVITYSGRTPEWPA